MIPTTIILLIQSAHLSFLNWPRIHPFFVFKSQQPFFLSCLSRPFSILSEISFRFPLFLLLLNPLAFELLNFFNPTNFIFKYLHVYFFLVLNLILYYFHLSFKKHIFWSMYTNSLFQYWKAWYDYTSVNHRKEYITYRS